MGILSLHIGKQGWSLSLIPRDRAGICLIGYRQEICPDEGMANSGPPRRADLGLGPLPWAANGCCSSPAVCGPFSGPHVSYPSPKVPPGAKGTGGGVKRRENRRIWNTKYKIKIEK